MTRLADPSHHRSGHERFSCRPRRAEVWGGGPPRRPGQLADRGRSHLPSEDGLPLIREAGVQALAGPSLHFVLKSMGLDAEMAAARDGSLRLYWWTTCSRRLPAIPRRYRLIDVTFYATEYERRLHWELLADRFAPVARDVSLEFEQRDLRLHHARPADPRRPGSGAPPPRDCGRTSGGVADVSQNGGAGAVSTLGVEGRVDIHASVAAGVSGHPTSCPRSGGAMAIVA